LLDIRLRVHSFVDVITNSSSTTYIYPVDGAEKLAHDAIENLMAVFGVTGSVEDYFEIRRIVNDTDYLESCDLEDDDKFPEAEGLEEDELEKLLDRLIEEEDPRLADLVDVKHQDLVIRAKDSNINFDLGNAVFRLFEIEASWN
jgi:hypothetical protein